MKKVVRLLMPGLLIIVLQGNIPSPTHLAVAPTFHSTKATPSTHLLTYYWYEDEDFTSYTGYSSAVDIEVNRLRALHPYNIVSSSPGIGLYEYEYGLHSFYIPAVIYANIP